VCAGVSSPTTGLLSLPTFPLGLDFRVARCADTADAYNVGNFDLPNPAGKAGGACTSALLQTLYRDGKATEPMSWVQALRQMRSVLRNMGFDVRKNLDRDICRYAEY
jgi:hypothetical protein